MARPSYRLRPAFIWHNHEDAVMEDEEITTAAFVMKRARRVETIVEEKIVNLQLPYDVAVSLCAIVSKVRGSAATSYRAHSDALLDALERAGVDPDYTRFSGTLDAKEHS